jgi:hypothetical protein
VLGTPGGCPSSKKHSPKAKDQGAAKPFDLIRFKEVGDEINDANAFAASF